MAGEIRPRPAAVAALPDLPARPPRTAISGIRSPRSARCSPTSPSSRRRRSSSRPQAFLLALVIGIPLGILAAVRRDSWIDHLAPRGLADRRLVADLLARLHRARRVLRRAADRARPRAARPDRLRADDRHRSLPCRHRVIAGDWETFRDAAAHLVLPSIVLAAATLGLITRTTRASMLETMRPGLRPRRPRQGPARAHASFAATCCRTR